MDKLTRVLYSRSRQELTRRFYSLWCVPVHCLEPRLELGLGLGQIRLFVVVINITNSSHR
jgi:hypothetical protein